MKRCERNEKNRFDHSDLCAQLRFCVEGQAIDVKGC